MDNAFVFFRGLYEFLTLKDIMGKRLFDMGVFAGLTCPDTGKRMPMVGCCDADCINAFVFEEFADVDIGFGEGLVVLP